MPYRRMCSKPRCGGAPGLYALRLAIGKVTYRGGAVGVGGVSWTAGGGRGQLGVAEGCQGAGWGGYQAIEVFSG